SMSEAIVSGRTGLLARAADPGTLANAIAYLLDHPDEGRRMALTAREHVAQRCRPEVLGEDFDEVYALALRDVGVLTSSTAGARCDPVSVCSPAPRSPSIRPSGGPALGGASLCTSPHTPPTARLPRWSSRRAASDARPLSTRRWPQGQWRRGTTSPWATGRPSGGWSSRSGCREAAAGACRTAEPNRTSSHGSLHWSQRF